MRTFDQNTEDEWATAMRAALAGDSARYKALLLEMSAALQAYIKAGLRRAGAPAADADDILQETLLALHLKRHTWDPSEKLAPWVFAIARYKLIDAMRRRGRRIELPIEPFENLLPEPTPEGGDDLDDVRRLMQSLPGRQGEIVRAIAISQKSARDVAVALRMTEGAVRVALHRGLKRLATLYRLQQEQA